MFTSLKVLVKLLTHQEILVTHNLYTLKIFFRIYLYDWLVRVICTLCIQFMCTLATPYFPLCIHFQPDSYVFTEDYHFSYSIPGAGSMWGMGMCIVEV